MCIKPLTDCLAVKVASDNTVGFEGRIYKLSNFAVTFMPDEKRNAADTYQGPKYFSHNGKVLSDLRDEMEENQLLNYEPHPIY